MIEAGALYPGNSFILAVTAEINAIYDCDNQQLLIKYYHASFFSPTLLAMESAAKAGYLRGCPGLTSEALRRWLKSPQTEMEMGHMRQVQQGSRSTSRPTTRGRQKPTRTEEIKEASIETATVPEQTLTNECTHHVFLALVEEGQLFSDQTGAFPWMSNRGNKYVTVFYVYDANAILSVPIKSRKKEELLQAYEEAYKRLQLRGFKPKLHKLDNETSQDVEEFVASQQAKIQ